MPNPTRSWTFSNTPEIVFGPDAAEQIKRVVGQRRTLVITSPGTKARGTIGRLTDDIKPGLARVFSDVESHYPMDRIDQDAKELSADRYECILAVGGGSVIDAAKCFSVLLRTLRGEFSLRQHFKEHRPLPTISPLPVVAVPTTAGSGSEVTPFATVWDYQDEKKYSLSTRNLLPETAIIDPELTATLPRRPTITSGLDAISHALESVWNRNASPVTMALATRSLTISLDALPTAAITPEDSEARAAMSEASLLAGLAISNSRTALAHSISYPLTVILGIEHGFACSFTLPAILRFNADVDDGRLLALARGVGKSGIDELADALIDLFLRLGIAEYLAQYDLSAERLTDLSRLMIDPSRADNNLRQPDTDSISTILRESASMISNLSPGDDFSRHAKSRP